jgi:hypothetical protein
LPAQVRKRGPFAGGCGGCPGPECCSGLRTTGPGGRAPHRLGDGGAGGPAGGCRGPGRSAKRVVKPGVPRARAALGVAGVTRRPVRQGSGSRTAIRQAECPSGLRTLSGRARGCGTGVSPAPSAARRPAGDAPQTRAAVGLRRGEPGSPPPTGRYAVLHPPYNRGAERPGGGFGVPPGSHSGTDVALGSEIA